MPLADTPGDSVFFVSGNTKKVSDRARKKTNSKMKIKNILFLLIMNFTYEIGAFICNDTLIAYETDKKAGGMPIQFV